jgi:hypothetical protein
MPVTVKIFQGLAVTGGTLFIALLGGYFAIARVDRPWSVRTHVIVLASVGLFTFLCWVLKIALEQMHQRRTEWEDSYKRFRAELSALGALMDEAVSNYSLIQKAGFTNWRAVFRALAWPQDLDLAEPLSTWREREKVLDGSQEHTAYNVAAYARERSVDLNRHRMAMNAEVESWVEWHDSRRFGRFLGERIVHHKPELVLYAYLEIVEAVRIAGTAPAGPWSKLSRQWAFLGDIPGELSERMAQIPWWDWTRLRSEAKRVPALNTQINTLRRQLAVPAPTARTEPVVELPKLSDDEYRAIDQVRVFWRTHFQGDKDEGGDFVGVWPRLRRLSLTLVRDTAEHSCYFASLLERLIDQVHKDFLMVNGETLGDTSRVPLLAAPGQPSVQLVVLTFFWNYMSQIRWVHEFESIEADVLQRAPHRSAYQAWREQHDRMVAAFEQLRKQAGLQVLEEGKSVLSSDNERFPPRRHRDLASDERSALLDSQRGSN